MYIYKAAALVSLVLLLSLCSVSLPAQCKEDTHSNNIEDSWLSCQTSDSPNPTRGQVHWIMYDLGYTYTLGEAQIWNYNVAGETSKGFKAIAIDYSLNGTDWINAGSFQLAQASGTNNYTGFTGFDFEQVEARYILLSALSTWEDGNCAGLSEFKVEVGQSLPLDLLHFAATPNNDCIALHWLTNNEVNFSHFEIERSIDGENFDFLTQVMGKNGAANNEYEIYDRAVEKNTLYYYRLKMIDLDGSYNYSPIDTARLSSDSEFTLYPNPSKDVLHLLFKENFTDEIVIRNATGHEILRSQANGKRHFVDISSFPSGVYFCSLFGIGQGIVTKRFIKVK